MNTASIERMKKLPVEKGLERAGFRKRVLPEDGGFFLPMGPGFNLILEPQKEGAPLDSWSSFAYLRLDTEIEPGLLKEAYGKGDLISRPGKLDSLIFPFIDAAEARLWIQEKQIRAEEEKVWREAPSASSEYLFYALKRRLESEAELDGKELEAFVANSELVIDTGGERFRVVKSGNNPYLISRDGAWEMHSLDGFHSIEEIENDIELFIYRKLKRLEKLKSAERFGALIQAFRDLGFFVGKRAFYHFRLSREGQSAYVEVQCEPYGAEIDLHSFRANDTIWKHSKTSLKSTTQAAEDILRALQEVERVDQGIN